MSPFRLAGGAAGGNQANAAGGAGGVGDILTGLLGNLKTRDESSLESRQAKGKGGAK